MDELLTIRDTMRILRVSRSTLFNLMNAGALPSVKIGRSRRFKSSDLTAFIEALRG